MSLTTRHKCPVCGTDVYIALSPELLRQASEKGVARVLARCPRGHAIVATIDQYGYVRSALPVQETGRQNCEVTDKAPTSIRARLIAILEKGAVTDADLFLLEKAKAAGWVICV
jgi:hypothetical protein